MKKILVVLLLCGCFATEPDIRDINGDGLIEVCVLGDSNTAEAYPPAPRGFPGWCAQLQTERPEWVVHCEWARGSAVAADFPKELTDAHPEFLQYTARWQIEESIVNATCDVYVLAFGTNDLALGKTGAEIRDQLFLLGATYLIPHIVYVTTIPNTYNHPLQPKIDAANSVLIDSFPYLVDFTSGFKKRHFDDDGVHFTEAGHTLRMQRFLDATGDGYGCH